MKEAPMKLWLNVAAVVMAIVGMVWTLQGAGIIGGSFMSGRSEWLSIGLAMLVAAAVAAGWANFAGGR
jgi:hypothetical protein